MVSLRHVRAVGSKELRQIGRDRRTLMVLLVLPAMLLLLYGYALNFDIRHVALAVQDEDRTATSRALISAFVNSGYFDLVAEVSNDRELEHVLLTNDARAVLVIPHGLEREAHANRPSQVQLIVNGDNANTATTVVAYAVGIIGTISAQYELQVRSATAGRPLVSIEPRVWYNPELRSALFLVPGLIAYIAMLTAVVSTALSIVREKEFGTMEQVRMAPISPASYVLGKTAPYFAVSLLSAMSIVVLSMALFGLPMRGSWLVLLAAIALFLVAALALGLMISAIAETQQVAFQLALLTSFLPTLMLSGFIFPIASMPAFLQVVTYGVPAKYFLSALRGIVLKGVGLEVIWPQLLALAGFAVLLLGLASLRLRRMWA